MQQTSDQGDPRWWLDDAAVHGFIHGVFEGGGVKGLLYVGALQGVVKRRLWFSAVAGSSAGAITAAMIAAGLRPCEMRRKMNEALKAMALPATWNGYRRLRAATGFLNHEKVRDWLTEVLQTQALRMGAGVKQRAPTFQELFQLTGIELNVVAVDLSARRLIVFNHTLTPDADVAASVMASATIPFAFEPLLFRTESEVDTTELAESASDGFDYRLIADGGIASNFPSFVFLDAGFRRFARLNPVRDTVPIVGFLLEEDPATGSDLRGVYRSGRFVGTLHQVERARGSVRAEIPEFRSRSADRAGTKLLRLFAGGVDSVLFFCESVILIPVIWLGKGFERPYFWNIPSPSNRHLRLWSGAFRTWMSTSPVPVIAGVITSTMIFGIGLGTATETLYSGLGAYAREMRSFEHGVAFILGALLGTAAIVLSIWMFLLGFGVFALLRVSVPTLGVLGRPLLRTFLQTPAASPWAGYAKNETIVRLPVPAELTTLTVGKGMDLRGVLKTSRSLTYASLRDVQARR